MKIIFAEDSYFFRKGVISSIADYTGFCIAEAGDGQELLDLLETSLPDIILLDIEMPVLDGNKTLDIINQRYAGLKIIILSQHGDVGLVENYIRRGVKGYIPKDLMASNIEMLVEGINTVASGGTFFYSDDPSGKKIKYSRREVDVLPLISQGKTSKETGEVLGLTEKRINAIRYGLYKKTKSRTAVDFAYTSCKNGLIYLSNNYLKK